MKSLININFNKLFKYYLIFICFSSIFFMSRTFHLDVNNSMAEWLINYQGGFGRRGLLGELFSQLSLKYDIHVRKIILYFLYFIFISYYFLIYYFFKDIKKNKLIILSILSPLFIILPLAELEALGRKDLLIPLSFLVCIILFNKTNFFGLYVGLVFFFPILLLIHEVSIFYSPFFLILLVYKIKNFNYFQIGALIIFVLLIVGVIFILSNMVHSSEQIKIMCDHMKYKLNDECGMAAYVLDRVLKDNISELSGLNVFHLFRNFLIFIVGYSALLILILNSKFTNYQGLFIKNIIGIKSLILFFLFIPTLIPFAIAVDWGRWYNLSYSLLILFYFFSLKNNFISLKKNIFFSPDNPSFNQLNFSYLKNKSFFILLVIILCFSWNPKAVYHEDIGSIPLYRMITKIIKYY